MVPIIESMRDGKDIVKISFIQGNTLKTILRENHVDGLGMLDMQRYFPFGVDKFIDIPENTVIYHHQIIDKKNGLGIVLKLQESPMLIPSTNLTSITMMKKDHSEYKDIKKYVDRFAAEELGIALPEEKTIQIAR